LKPNTRKNGTLKEGAPVTVYYRKQEGEATQVDVVEALKGLLLPGNQADPPMPSSCGVVPPNALRIYIGSSAGWTSGDEITALRIKGTDILGLRRTSNGLAIVAQIFSEDGKSVAQIIDNHFYVNPDNFFLMNRPDSHSLVVFDQHERKALDISYINRHSVTVSGIFQFPGVAPIIVSQNEVLIGGSRFFGACSGNSTTIFAVQ
jgi:hypothetical protein